MSPLEHTSDCSPSSHHIPLRAGSTLFLILSPSFGVVNLRPFLSLEEDCMYVLVSLWIFFTVSLPVLSHSSPVCLLGCRCTQNPGIQSEVSTATAKYFFPGGTFKACWWRGEVLAVLCQGTSPYTYPRAVSEGCCAASLQSIFTSLSGSSDI